MEVEINDHGRVRCPGCGYDYDADPGEIIPCEYCGTVFKAVPKKNPPPGKKRRLNRDAFKNYFRYIRNLFTITETELKAIAPAAMMGLKRPAMASGMATML